MLYPHILEVTLLILHQTLNLLEKFKLYFLHLWSGFLICVQVGVILHIHVDIDINICAVYMYVLKFHLQIYTRHLKYYGIRDRKCGRSTRLMCNKQQHIVMGVESVPQCLRPLTTVLYLRTTHSAVLLLAPSSNRSCQNKFWCNSIM